MFTTPVLEKALKVVYLRACLDDVVKVLRKPYPSPEESELISVLEKHYGTLLTDAAQSFCDPV